MRKSIILLALATIVGCQDTTKIGLAEGIWSMELEVMDSQVLPFNFKLSRLESGKYSMEIYNADETILVDEIIVQGDSIIIRPPVFQGYLAGKFTYDRN